MSEHTMRSLLIDGANGAGLLPNQVQQMASAFDEMQTGAERGKLVLPGWEQLGEWVQANASAVDGKPGEHYADILLRALPLLVAQARRYRFIRGMVQIEPDSPEGEALNEILERPDLQPSDAYSQEAFDAQYDAMLAAASEKCPTIAAALNMEI